MRCPKCGYISFDHIETCLKCNKDISGGVEVEGTTYHAAAPSFLRVPQRSDGDDEELQAEEFEDEAFELSDPDLAVLSDDDEIDFIDDEEDVEDIAIEEVGGDIDFQLEADEELEEDGFDFDFDDDAAAPSVPEQEEQLSFSVPDELADISDLAPPSVRERLNPADSGSGMDLSFDDEMDLDDSLDLDGLDLDLGLGTIGGDADKDFQALSLDDIELSEEDIALDSSELEGVSMDLDLDGLDEKPKTEKEKSPGSLDGLSLSLD